MTYQKQKAAVLSLIDKMYTLEEVKSNPELKKRLDSLKTKINNEKIIMVVAGEFKRGKSSLINALLNEKGCELFPVDPDITTNLVSTITYGAEEKISIVLDGKNNESMAINRNDIAEYVTEQKNEGNTKRAKMLQIASPNPILNDGLTIVDTPGVAINPDHTAITYEFIPNADLVLYTTDIQAPLDGSEMDFIKTIHTYCKNIIFVVTKKDLVADSNSIIASNKEKLSNILGKKPEDLRVIAVSSGNKLDYLKSHDEEDLEDSNFTLLEAMIQDMIKAKRAELTLVPALNVIGEMLINIKAPLVNLWNVCRSENKSMMGAKQKEYEDAVQKKNRLLAENSDWSNYLTNELKRIRLVSDEEAADGIAGIQKSFEDYINVTANMKEPDKAISFIEAQVNEFLERISANNTQRIVKLSEELVEKTSLAMNEPIYETAGFKFPDEDITIDHKRTGIFSKSIQAVRMSMFNGSAGAVIGGAIGGILGTVFTGGILGLPLATWGATIGGAIGEFIGIRDGLKMTDDKDKAALRNKVKPLLDRAIANCRNSIAKQLLEFEISMRDELIASIKAQKELYEKMIADMKAAATMSASESAARVKELEDKIKALNMIFKDFEAVINDIKKPAQTNQESVKKQADLNPQSTFAWAE